MSENRQRTGPGMRPFPHVWNVLQALVRIHVTIRREQNNAFTVQFVRPSRRVPSRNRKSVQNKFYGIVYTAGRLVRAPMRQSASRRHTRTYSTTRHFQYSHKNCLLQNGTVCGCVYSVSVCIDSHRSSCWINCEMWKFKNHFRVC